jgi:hypothetical protein
VFGPGARESGPDLIPALHLGYGLGRGEGLGRVMFGKPLVEPNLSAWVGGHEGPYLPSDVAGMVAMAGPHVPAVEVPPDGGLEDIAPTVLYLLGLGVPGGMSGRSLL